MQREPVREVARGRWAGILGQHLDERTLAGRHGPCPMCGGRDRFRFDNREGSGSWICSHCGAGDGFMLLQELNGWTFSEAAQHVEAVAGKIQQRDIPAGADPEAARKALLKTWEGAKPIEDGDPAFRYLLRRCAWVPGTPSLRCHPALKYRHDDGSFTEHPALVARVTAADGKGATLHRTYLTADGQKADLPRPKKLMTPTQKLENVAIRLGPIESGWLGVAEGIETALCASRRFSVPVWAIVCAGMLETFRPPKEVRTLYVFGDNDAGYVGQAAAYRLAKAVAVLGVEVRVHIPERTDTDWADPLPTDPQTTTQEPRP